MSSMHAFAVDSSDESSDDENDFLHPSTDPNADEFADYNPRKRRRTGRDAKESAALGIFGSESEDEGPGKRWKGKNNLRGKGMAFVSTGQKKLDEDEDEDDDDKADEDVDMDDDEENADEESTTGSKGGLGLGFGPSRGLGFQSPREGKPEDAARNTVREGLGMGFGANKGIAFQTSTPQKSQHLGGNRSTPLGRGFVPSSASAPILRDADDGETSTPRISRPSAFSTPVSGNGRGAAKSQAAGSAVNSSSFAARMMAKMGYKEGQGLGKEGQGRSGVIEVQLRPQGVGLGAVREKSKQEKEEEKRQARLKGEVYEDSDEERKKKRAQKPKTSGASSGMSTPRKSIKPKYRTVEELEKAAPGLKIPDAFAPILDMTGPGQRLLTSTSGLLTPTQPASETVEQAENKKLARRAQNDLSSFVEEWKNLQERKAYVDMQMLQQQQEIEETQPDLVQIKQFSDIVKEISKAVKESQWDPVVEALKSVNGLELSAHNETLSSIAVAAVHPFLREFVNGWQPLDDPKMNDIAPSLFKIRHILGAQSTNRDLSHGDLINGMSRIRIKSTSPYESMIYKIIFPKIVSCINQSWNVHNPTPLLALMDSWEGLLPGFVRSQILDQAVVGKLNEAVSSWNPRKRRSAHELPHLWLFPWLQYLPSHHADPKSSTGLVTDVKRKFRKLIDSWDFRKGVVPGLLQWREVLCPTRDNDQWTPLVMNHIIPSMASFLINNFAVEPQEQELKLPVLQGILAWKDILKPQIIGQVIADKVFPMWHDVLHQWLTETGPNEEIGLWFQWWRDDVFPKEIQSLKIIQQEFDKGHDMINQALDLGPRAATDLPAPSRQIHQTEKSKSPPPPPAPTRPSIPEETNIRHQVESWCLENELQFLPERKVFHDAGPLYRITAAGNGKNGVLVYFKGEHLLALQKIGGEALPIIWDNEEGKDALMGMAYHNVR